LNLIHFAEVGSGLAATAAEDPKRPKESSMQRMSFFMAQVHH
jgi:hypothetical protein